MKSFSETKGTVTRTAFDAQHNCFFNAPMQHPFLASLEHGKSVIATAQVIAMPAMELKLAA